MSTLMLHDGTAMGFHHDKVEGYVNHINNLVPRQHLKCACTN